MCANKSLLLLLFSSLVSFFSQALADGFPLESEWQPVYFSLQDFS